MKRKSIKIGLSLLLSFSFLFSFLSPANATSLFSTITSTCTDYGMNTNWQLFQPVTAAAPATITSIDVKLFSLGTPSYLTLRLYTDNSGTPGSTLLGTFTYSSVVGLVATYTGNVTIPAAGKFWIKFSATGRVDECWYAPPTTTGSLAGWSTTTTWESSDSGSTFAARVDSLSFLFTLNGTGGVLASASSVSVTAPATPTYRQLSTITANLGVAGSDGKVTFYANDKVIPGCSAILSSSLVATCSWKPSMHGTVRISARLIPSSTSYLTSSSKTISTGVVVRSNNR